MPDATNKDKKKKSETPEQKLGDTPVAPWEMPTPEEKAQAKPVRRALKEAVANVDSPEKAEEVIQKLETANHGKTTQDVEQAQPATATPADAARQVEKAAEKAPNGKKTEEVLQATAQVLTTPDKRQQEVVAEAVQEVLNPEQQGATPSPTNVQQREYLREAVLKRLKPLDALDANLFLAVNHLPHSRYLNTFFYTLTVIFNGGAAWFVTSALAVLFKRRGFKEMFRDVAVPLTITTALVEFPIKAYFRRRRPFISIIQAIVIGKKPGTWSFPSGHSAAAFAGAWLFNRKFPGWSPLTYLVASQVGFSRIYLGDHYPGDVASGSMLGLLFAMLFRKLLGRKR
jgi:undecaprenyl-diphosphatase